MDGLLSPNVTSPKSKLGLELLTMHQIPEMPRPTSIPMPPSPNSESADSRERGESQQQGGSKPGSSGHFPMGTPDAEMRSSAGSMGASRAGMGQGDLGSIREEDHFRSRSAMSGLDGSSTPYNNDFHNTQDFQTTRSTWNHTGKTPLKKEPRQLHKKNPAPVPQPCLDGNLPPWISMKNKPIPMKSRSSSSVGLGRRKNKVSRQKVDPQVALRALRGAYLPLHEEEQERIPLMASMVDVDAANRFYVERESESLEAIHAANYQLKEKLEEFSNNKRSWSQKNRGGRRLADEPPAEGGVLGFDRPARPAKSKREIYRANGKLRSPRKTKYDTVAPASLYIRTPMRRDKAVLPDISPDQEPEGSCEPQASGVKSPLADVRLIPQGEMRERLFMMEKEINDVMSEAKTLDIGRWDSPEWS